MGAREEQKESNVYHQLILPFCVRLPSNEWTWIDGVVQTPIKPLVDDI
jgi:hypothetical protein